MMNPQILTHAPSLPLALPEIALAALAALAFLVDLVPRWRGRGVVARLTACGLVGVFFLVLVAHGYAREMGPYAMNGRVLLFHGALAYDAFAAFLKGLFFLAGLFAVLLAFPAVRRGAVGDGEFHGLLLICLLGLCLLASAANLLMIVLALELVSLPSYVLVGLLRRDRRSCEAALKYALYGAFASGTMIFGLSLLVGMTGATDLAALGPALRAKLAAGGVPAPVAVAVLLLVLAGFGYKIAAVPFHFWCPDVYEGAPTAVTAFLSVGPKAAGFAVLIRFLDGLFLQGAAGGASVPWRAVLAILCVATMTWGNLAALSQQNLKRLLAYSSIAHAGYLLMGVTLGGAAGAQAVLFYLAVYLFMNLGAFACVIAIEERLGIADVAGCRGLGRRFPFLAAAMTIFLLSLTGIPPVSGFAGKLMLFQALVGARAWPWIALAVIGVLNSVVSLVYYARIIKAMYIEEAPADAPPEAPDTAVPAYYGALVGLCLLPTVVLGVWFGPLLEWTRRAAASLGR